MGCGNTSDPPGQKPFKSRLNVLPENPDVALEEASVDLGRFPKWLHRRLPEGGSLWKTHSTLTTHRLPTVCEEARCPNLLECYSKKTATFLAMGKECTRNCGFCSIDFSLKPKSLEEDEPKRLAEAVSDLGLSHVVITMVARDDLPDGGAAHLSKILAEVKRQNDGVTVEILTSDFAGSTAALDTLLGASFEIFNHNIETVRALSSHVRHKATYDRTLATLSYMRKNTKQLYLKSGIMVGLGETQEQVKETLRDLAQAGCHIVTIGQYLQPNKQKLRVKAFIHQELYEEWAAFGKEIGIEHVFAGPFVRSSYNAETLFKHLKGTHPHG